MGFWRRLLGFCPADKPYYAICRPRYSFCAEGRSDSPADAALGFFPLSGFDRWPPDSTSGLFPPGLTPVTCGASAQTHVAMSGAPFGVAGGRRLADPAVFPSASASLSEVFAPSIKRPPILIGAWP